MASRPLVTFVDDVKITDEIQGIVERAQHRLILVCPFHDHWNGLQSRIMQASKRGVEVIICFNPQRLGQREQQDPARFYEEVLGIPIEGLHAKIYANESEVLITSMNLQDRPALNSREAGLLVRDPDIKSDIDKYINELTGGAVRASVANESDVISAQNPTALSESGLNYRIGQERSASIKPKGYCIKCGQGNRDGYTPFTPLGGCCYRTTVPLGSDGRPNLNDPAFLSTPFEHCHGCRSTGQFYLEHPLCPDCIANHEWFCTKCKRPLDGPRERYPYHCGPWGNHYEMELRYCHRCGKDNPGNTFPFCYEHRDSSRV